MFRNMEISIRLIVNVNHIKLRFSFFFFFPTHCSIGYVRRVLKGPGNNRGQECQIMLFHMAVNA